jgi:prepilin-type N-terminal cleavage/methylation domain-containing protein
MKYRKNRDDCASTRATASRRRGSDQGFSFVEVVVTIVLLGVLVTAILTAVRASITASSVSRTAAQVESVLLNAVDRVNRAPRGDFPCDLSAPVVAAVETQGWPAANAAVAQEYLDAGSWQTGPAGAQACPGGVFRQGLVQRISITITSPDGELSRTIQVVKSDV